MSLEREPSQKQSHRNMFGMLLGLQLRFALLVNQRFSDRWARHQHKRKSSVRSICRYHAVSMQTDELHHALSGYKAWPHFDALEENKVEYVECCHCHLLEARSPGLKLQELLLGLKAPCYHDQS